MHATAQHAHPDGGLLPRACRLSLALSACLAVACVAYHPKPLDPAASVRRLEARSLQDAGLRAYVEKSASTDGVWPPPRWDFPSLLRVSLFFSSDLALAGSKVAVAEAEARAAGLRQDPSVSLSLEKRMNNLQGAPSSTWGPTLDIPVAAWGKRGIRQAEAGARLRESQHAMARTAWQVRSSLRSASVASDDVRDRLEVAGALVAAREKVLSLMEARLAAGEVSAPEVALARSEAQAARLALRKSHEAESAARSGLARAVGVPVAALDGVALSLLERPLPPTPEAKKAREAALTGRSDLLAALSAYAASDQALRLAVREQYPDLHLSPGYLWDQGSDAWVLGLATLLPVVNRNRGGIDKAEAARAAEDQKVLALQESILHEIEAAQAAYESARQSLEEAEKQEQARRAFLDAVRRSLDAGEEDALALALAQAGLAAARTDTLDARRAAWDALGRLEDALELPILPDAPMPRLPEVIAKEGRP